MTNPGTTEDLLRELAPQVLAALVRRYGYGQFHLCEDAAQEALLAATVQWPAAVSSSCQLVQPSARPVIAASLASFLNYQR